MPSLPPSRLVVPLLPAATVGLFGLSLGTFWGSARGAPTVLGWILLAGLAIYGAGRWRDPLGIGRWGGVAWALWLAMAASLLTSPVPRTGSTAVLLLPLYLLLPAAIAVCFERPGARAMGLRAVAAAVSLASAWALWDRFLGDSLRAAMPLGHHNLLAFWLVALWPIAFAVALERGCWGWWGRIATALALAALVATGSLSGALATSCQVAILVLYLVAAWRRKRRALVVVVAVAVAAAGVLAATQSRRLLSILTATDTSSSARLAYLEAGWRGLLERPILGWGPGSSSWLLGEHLGPRPGLLPPHQIVSDLHSLPFEIVFELGLAGGTVVATLGLLISFRLPRAVPSATAAAVDPRRAAAAAWFGILVFGALGGAFDLPAIWTAIALPLGVLAGRRSEVPMAAGRRARWIAAVCGLVLFALLWPRARAQHHFERGVAALELADQRRAERELERAVALDPQFPLYRHLWADRLSGPRRAQQHREAALAARGLSALWLRAGIAAGEEGGPALLEACDLDPLGSIAPFLWVVNAASRDDLSPPPSVEEERLVIERAARALLLEPRLAAAVAWSGRLEALRSAIVRVTTEPGLDAGWRAAAARQMTAAASEIEALAAGDSAAGSQPGGVALTLDVDQVAETSLSLFAFRRLPAPRQLARIPLRLPAGFGLPPATTSPGFPDELLRSGCRLAATPPG